MTGLRERQKVERERRILDAAVTLFRKQGFRRARMEDIAERAALSVGTLYNYHGTKGDLLIAVVAMEVEEVLEAGEAIVADPPADPGDAILSLVGCYYDHSLRYLSKEMWRAAMALSIEAPDTPNGQRYAELDRRLAAQTTALIGAFQARGKVDGALDPAPLGDVIFATLNMLFIDYVRDEEMAATALAERAAAQLRPLARLIAA
jgi:AcrR family transcriptional regulator